MDRPLPRALLTATLALTLCATSAAAQHASGTDIVPSGDRAYSFINQFINAGLVNGYGRGFTISRVSRDTMAKYLSLVFDGKSAAEIVASGSVRESDLTTLGELVNDYIEELSSQYSNKLSSLLEKSMKVRSLLDRKALDKGETGGATAVTGTKIQGDATGASRPAATARTGAGSPGPGSTGTAATATGPDAAKDGATAPPAPVWERKFNELVTFRNINTANGVGYELNNAEKKAGFTTDLNLNYSGIETDGFGTNLVEESAFFQQKNSDLYDYFFGYSDKARGTTYHLGYKLRPDITEYTFRGEDLKGLYTEYALGTRALTSAFFGRVKIDNQASDEIGVVGVSSKLNLTDRYAMRLSLIQGDDINRVASLEQIYKPDAKSLHELEYINSRYFENEDMAYEYRWKQQIRNKLVVSSKYKNIGDNFTTILNPSMLADVRKTDMRYFESVLNYRFTPYITNTTTLINSNENYALQVAPRIPIDTNDYTTIFLSAVPKRPKYLVYLKDQKKTGLDGLGTSGKNDRMKLALVKIDYNFGKFYPRIGYTKLTLDNRDATAGTPVALDTQSLTKSFGFDYLIFKDLTLKLDYQLTNSDSGVSTIAGGATVLTQSNSDSKVTSVSLDRKLGERSDLIYTWYTERRTGTEDVDKTSNGLTYSRKVRKNLDANLLYERIRYTDAITLTNTYDSDEFALTLNATF